MKKKIALVLLLTMILSMCSVCTFAAEERGIKINVDLRDTGTFQLAQAGVNQKDIMIKQGVTIGQYIKSDNIIAEIIPTFVSYGNNVGSLTFRLYAWKGNYKKTVASKPITEQVCTNFNDNSKVTFNVSAYKLKGEFLFTIGDSVETVGVWSEQAANSNMTMFTDGEKNDGIAVRATVKYYIEKELPGPDMTKVRDAYSPIPLSEFEEAKNNYAQDANGIWAVYVRQNEGLTSYTVDFGKTPPKSVELYLKDELIEYGKIQVVADNPQTGPVLCEFETTTKSAPHDYTTQAPMLKEITGVHKIYLLTRSCSFRMYTLKFSHEEAKEEGEYKALLKEYNETKDNVITDTYSDTWVATDLLGRKLPDNETVGDPNPDKKVAIYFWTWHSGLERLKSSYEISNNQRVIDSYDGNPADIINNYDYAGFKANGFWNESIYGYYTGFDTWVLRKQLELLSSADIDAVITDASNQAALWQHANLKLFKVMHEMSKDGIETPKFATMLPFSDKPNVAYGLERLYESIYKTGLYEKYWFYWDGKPVIEARADAIETETGHAETDALYKEMLDFFTFRPGHPLYRTPTIKEVTRWPWLEAYPQQPFGTSEKYGCETVGVSIAQNMSDKMDLSAMNGEGIYGRSYTYKDKHTKLSETSKYYGYNFQEQWDRAFELNPELVIITGWNEWVANKQKDFLGVKAAYPDTFNDEYSRDIEPTKGEFKDTYYYQMVSNIRKFKGVRKTPVATAEKTIDIGGSFSQWNDVGPGFIGYKGGVEKRDDIYLGGKGSAVNTTGRNDIILSKVARDKDNLYFYVKTAQDITPYTDNAWMRLFINTDRLYKTGWEGYDYIINRVNPDSRTVTVEKWNGTESYDWKWEIAGTSEYRLSGNEMMIKIPRAMLGIDAGTIDIEFKWNDNMQIQGDIMDFYTNGDTAPVGRFNYRYVEDLKKGKKAVDEPIDPAQTLAHKTRRFVIMALDRNIAHVFGTKTKIDNLSDTTAPMIINDKTMVPVRFVAESMGALVEWDDEQKIVKIQYNGMGIRFVLDKNIMNVDGKRFIIQSPATEIENRIYVPLRDIVEVMGMTCNWVDPGVIVVGPQNDFSIFYMDGGLEKIMDEYGIEFNN